MADMHQRKTEFSPLNSWILRKMEEAVRQGTDFNIFQTKGSVRRGIVEFVSSFFDEGFAEHSKAMSRWLEQSNAIRDFRKAVDDKIENIKAQMTSLMEAW